MHAWTEQIYLPTINSSNHEFIKLLFAELLIVFLLIRVYSILFDRHTSHSIFQVFLFFRVMLAGVPFEFCAPFEFQVEFCHDIKGFANGRVGSFLPSHRQHSTLNCPFNVC